MKKSEKIDIEFIDDVSAKGAALKYIKFKDGLLKIIKMEEYEK